MNLGPLPMGNGLSRLATRFHGREEALKTAAGLAGIAVAAGEVIVAQPAEVVSLAEQADLFVVGVAGDGSAS